MKKSILLLVLGFVFYAAAFEPFGVAEFAYVFAAFLYFGAKFWRGSNSGFFGAAFFGSWLAWAVILAWLRFVYPPSGWFFLAALSGVLALFFAFWIFCVRLFAPLEGDGFFKRLGKLGFLGALWVGLEYLRSFLFTGFPWLLLGHSQWRRPAVIQIAEFGGAYIVSFMLIFFNLALASYIFRMFAWHRARIRSGAPLSKFARITPEFYLAAIFVMASLYMYILNMPSVKNARVEFRVGMVQTDFAGILNWDAASGMKNLETLRALTLPLKNARVDAVLWSESSTPPMWPIIGTPQIKSWAEELSAEVSAPIIMGNGAYIPPKDGSPAKKHNIAAFVSETSGLSGEFYAKRHLVPFGEYIPSWCEGLVKTIVPIGSLTRGDSAVCFDVKIKNKIRKISPVICYEDVFPNLVRDAVLTGAEYIFVCTNDSWYGREGGAWQHAAHSALQAVSFRRSVLRASVNGLSGVFDQYGRMTPSFTLKNKDGGIFDGTGEAAAVLDVFDGFMQPLDSETGKRKLGSPLCGENGSIYARCSGYADVVSYLNFEGKTTFYAKHGDVFARACYYVSIAALLLVFARKFISPRISKPENSRAACVVKE